MGIGVFLQSAKRLFGKQVRHIKEGDLLSLG